LFKKQLKKVFYLPIILIAVVVLLQLSGPFNKIKSSFFAHNPPKQTPVLSKKVSPKPKTNVTPSSQIRLIVWHGAFKLIEKYPLFGSGTETFAYSYNSTRLKEHNLTSEWNFVYNKAHNELLNFLATTGSVGLASYLLLLAAFFLPSVFWLTTKRKQAKNFVIFYFCTLLAILLMNFFGFSTTVTSFYFYLLPAFWLIYLNESNNTKPTSPVPQRSLTRELTFGQLALYFVWLLFATIYLLNYYYGDYYYARAREYRQIQDFTNAYVYGQKALDLRQEPVYLDQQALVAANLSALQKIQKNSPQAKQFTDLAIKYNHQTIEHSPFNPAFYKTQAKIYYVLSLSYVDNEEIASIYLNKAVAALQKAARLAPTDPVIPYTEASLIHPKEPDRALELLEKTLELKPNYKQAELLINSLQKR